MISFKQFVDKLQEDGMGAAVATPANNVGAGKISGTGGAGGEPGVNKKKKTPIVMPMATRSAPKIC